LVNAILFAALILSCGALLLALYRLMRGPGVADRAVGLDVMTIIGVSVIGLIAVLMHRVIYLDVALVYAGISFVGVVAVARFIERGM
jgi:multicomponent Na+:H+ antiporter subunit F